MKVLAIGAAGKMGKAVAAYFAHEPGVEKLGLLDSQAGALEAMAKANGADILQLHPLDIEDTDELTRVMQQYDVIVVTLPNRRLSYKVMEAAIEARRNLIDIQEEYHRRPDVMQNPRGTLNLAWMSEPSRAAVPPTSLSPAPAAPTRGTMHDSWEPTAGPLESG